MDHRPTDGVDLTGQVAIVTGGGRGIGRAIAIGLASAGCHRRVSVRQMMAAVAVIGAILGVGRMAFHLLVRHTTYAPGLHLDRFDDRLIGMSRAEVSAIHGAPLRIYVSHPASIPGRHRLERPSRTPFPSRP